MHIARMSNNPGSKKLASFAQMLVNNHVGDLAGYSLLFFLHGIPGFFFPLLFWVENEGGWHAFSNMLLLSVASGQRKKGTKYVSWMDLVGRPGGGLAMREGEKIEEERGTKHLLSFSLPRGFNFPLPTGEPPLLERVKD